jgi:hypothetical protein
VLVKRDSAASLERADFSSGGCAVTDFGRAFELWLCLATDKMAGWNSGGAQARVIPVVGES